MKVTSKGILRNVSEIEEKQNYRIQRCHLYVPRFDPVTGEQVSSEFFPMSAMGPSIEKLNLIKFQDKKVEIDAFLNSSKKEKEGETFFNLYLNISKIKEI